jgi:hypothetical protein
LIDKRLVTTAPPISSQVKSNAMLSLGSQGAYEWLVTDENFDLLQLCPEIVLAKYVAVSSIDSGHFVLQSKRRPLAGRVVKK